MFGDQRIWTFSHPEDVLAFPGMSSAEKRSLLAEWASDQHAVENVPAMRQLPSGAVVSLDAILAALRKLDETATRDVPHRRPRNQGGSIRVHRWWRGRRRFHGSPDDGGPTSGGASMPIPYAPAATEEIAGKGGLSRPTAKALALRRKRVAMFQQLSCD